MILNSKIVIDFFLRSLYVVYVILSRELLCGLCRRSVWILP
jgi:hypothetical protein